MKSAQVDFPLAYCPDGFARLDRLRALYKDRRQDIVLAAMDTPSQTLARFAAERRAGPCDRPDLAERARFWDALLRERAAVLDDSVPSAYLSEMDQGLYGGLFGGRTEFACDPATGWISSMVWPLLEDWGGFEALRQAEDGEWRRFYFEAMRTLVDAGRGKFGISHFILINGLNFLFELLGATRAYLSLSEEPVMARRALDLAFDVNLDVQRAFFERVPLLCGGTCAYGAQWLPGRIISESLDPFHMTSVETFEAWGRGPVEKVFAAFDGGIVHIHGNGRHLLEGAASLRGLKAILLGDDTGFPAAFDVLADIRRRVGRTPLIVSVPFPRFSAALKEGRLVGGTLYLVSGAPTVDEANRAGEAARGYRAG